MGTRRGRRGQEKEEERATEVVERGGRQGKDRGALSDGMRGKEVAVQASTEGEGHAYT